MGRALIVVLLAGCSSNDALRPPEVPAAPQFTAGTVAEERLVAGRDIPADWWTLFHSPELDTLVRQALEASPTLSRASARLTQAQEDYAGRSGATQLPKVDAKLSANRIDVNPQSFGAQALPVKTPFNLYLASISVSYTFDFFGAARRELEALQAESERQRYELEAARLTLAGNVVTAAIREAALRESIALTEENIALQARQLAITEQLEGLGTAARADVVAQRAELARIRAALPDLRRQLEQIRHRLAIYTGQPPGAAKLPEFRLAGLQLPEELPLSLPSELARQRPDIRAAEALLQQAAARVGVATANLYPQITLSANVGSLAAGGNADLFGGGTGFFILGAALTQPLFHGDELQAKRRAAVAAYEQAGAAYKETVLQGFQNVADVLRALEADAAKVNERAEGTAQARSFRDIAAVRYKAGGVSYYVLLDAQRKLHQAQLDQTQALADRYADSAALLQALGGGWWRKKD